MPRAPLQVDSTGQQLAKLNRARRAVRRWAAWFFPPAILLVVLLWMRQDHHLIAVCLLSFPLILIRLVRAWNDYQQVRAALARVERAG